MAIQYKLKNTNTINAEGNRVYLEDATGIYDVVTNVGGYGTPNIDRDTTALVVLGLLKSTKGDKEISFEPYNPLTADKFNAIIGVDGWYTFNLISLPFLVDADIPDYEAGDVFYDTTYFKIVKIVDTLDPESVLPEYIRTVEEIPLIDLKESSYIVATTDTLFIANNSKTKLILNTKISNLIYDGADFSDKKLIRFKDNYNVIRAILQGAIYEFCRGNKFVAERDLEFLNNNNYVLD